MFLHIVTFFSRLIINDTLDSGTQIPFIKLAQKEGYGVLVMNTNDNYRIDMNKCKVKIRVSNITSYNSVFFQVHVSGAGCLYVACLILHQIFSYYSVLLRILYSNYVYFFYLSVYFPVHPSFFHVGLCLFLSGGW